MDNKREIELNFGFIPIVRYALLLDRGHGSMDFESRDFESSYSFNGLEYGAYLEHYSNYGNDIVNFVESGLFNLVDTLVGYLVIDDIPVDAGHPDINYNLMRLNLGKDYYIDKLSYNHLAGLDDDNEYTLSFVREKGESQIFMEYQGINAKIVDTSDLSSCNERLLQLIGYFIMGLVYKVNQHKGDPNINEEIAMQNKLIKAITGEQV